MPKMTRVFQKRFGLNGDIGNFGVFGSLAAGSPDYTLDPVEIQSLAAFLGEGWAGSTIGDFQPALEDMNGLFLLAFYQLAYLFEAGVPEWDDETTYWIGSIVKDAAGVLYRSLQNTNLNHATSDGAWWELVVGASNRATTGSFKSLAVTRPSVTQVTVTADELILDDGTLITGVNETAAITSSGADGLDTGSEASNTWYYIWIIRKSSDGTVASLLSASSTSPTMPSGYDQKALVSAVRNNGSSNFVDFKQRGKKYSYVVEPTVASGSFGSGSWTTTDISAFFPDALTDFAYFHSEGSTSDALYMTNDNSVSASFSVSAPNRTIQTAAASVRATFFCAFPILTANTIYLSANGTLYAVGFDITKI